jgi:hypothetical protein
MHTGQRGWLPNESGCVLALGDYVEASLGHYGYIVHIVYC